MERQNRMRYGVKKPANIWRHEMDDTRITAEQIRCNDFKANMFDAEVARMREVESRCRQRRIPDIKNTSSIIVSTVV